MFQGERLPKPQGQGPDNTFAGRGGFRVNAAVGTRPEARPKTPLKPEALLPPAKPPKKRVVGPLVNIAVNVGGSALALWGLHTAVDHLQGDNQSISQTEVGIESIGPTTFNPGSGQKLEPENIKPKKIQEEFKPNKGGIKTKKFEVFPPIRPPDNNTNQILGQLQTIPPHIENRLGGSYNNFKPGIEYRLKAMPSIIVEEKEVTPGRERSTVVKRDFPSQITITGFVIGSKINPEGSRYLAIWIPGKSGSFQPGDIERSLLSAHNTTNDANEGNFTGSIVWLKLENHEGQSLPFGFSAAWHPDTTAIKLSDKNTNIPEEVIKHVRIGDPVRAVAQPELTALDEERLSGNYNGSNYSMARARYKEIVDGNAAAIKIMQEDAKTGGISLRRQFHEQLYVVKPSSVTFVPR